MLIISYSLYRGPVILVGKYDFTRKSNLHDKLGTVVSDALLECIIIEVGIILFLPPEIISYILLFSKNSTP